MACWCRLSLEYVRRTTSRCLSGGLMETLDMVIARKTSPNSHHDDRSSCARTRARLNCFCAVIQNKLLKMLQGEIAHKEQCAFTSIQQEEARVDWKYRTRRCPRFTNRS